MTHERAHLRPSRPGLKVPDPDHGGVPLPPEGLEVVLSSYWLRRLRSGDVVAGAPQSEHRATFPAPRAQKPEKS